MIDRRRTLGLIGGGAAASMMPKAVWAQDQSDFYKNRDIEMVIASGPGGFDLVGRLIARHLSKHIPGEPNIIPRNMPGAGGRLAANYIANQAARDGTVISQLASTVLIDSIVGTEGANFDARDFNFLGRFARGLIITVAASGKAASMEEARQTQLAHATTGTGSIVYQLPNLANAVAGTDFDFVLGYTDSASTLLAVERGEADAASVSYSSLLSLHPEWAEKNDQANILLQYTGERTSYLPDVPAILEFVEGEDDKTLASLFLTSGDLGQYISAPPGIPQERVDVLRDAYMATVQDPEFLAEVKEAGIPFDPLSGYELQKVADDLTPSEAVVERAKKLIAGQ